MLKGSEVYKLRWIGLETKLLLLKLCRFSNTNILKRQLTAVNITTTLRQRVIVIIVWIQWASNNPGIPIHRYSLSWMVIITWHLLEVHQKFFLMRFPYLDWNQNKTILVRMERWQLIFLSGNECLQWTNPDFYMQVFLIEGFQTAVVTQSKLLYVTLFPR